MANHLLGFNTKIIGYAKNTISKEGFTKVYHEPDLIDFVSECDFIVNTLPDCEETRGLWNKSLLLNCKQHVSFINIGRDTIYNGNDFYEFLKSHKNSTAILDMFEFIPNPITNKYRRLSNVMVLPRIAAISQESDDKLKHLIKYNVQAYINNLELCNRIV